MKKLPSPNLQPTLPAPKLFQAFKNQCIMDFLLLLFSFLFFFFCTNATFSTHRSLPMANLTSHKGCLLFVYTCSERELRAWQRRHHYLGFTSVPQNCYVA